MVTFNIVEPDYKPLNPITPQVSEFAVKRLDGTVVAVASEGPSANDPLPLGVLMPTMGATDLQVQVLSGSSLLGMGRIRDVAIENGVQKSYDIAVRKPLLTIGGAVPAEPQVVNLPLPGQIIDPTRGTTDLSQGPMGPQLPHQTVAAAATWDGRFLLAASAMDKNMNVIDTGSGRTVGTVSLGFVPARIAVGARDSAAAVLDPAGSLTIFPDMVALTSNPSSAAGMKVALMGAQRTMTFAPDGLSILVLGGTDADPCSSAPPSKNGITVVGLDGTVKGNWMLPGFVSDLAADALSNRIVITDASNNRVDTFDAGAAFGTLNVQQISNARCPSAVRVVNGEAFVVTAERIPAVPPFTVDQFTLQRINVATGALAKVTFPGPVYDENANPMSAPDAPMLDFKLRSTTVYAYDLAVTPDGTRAVFASRTRYLKMPSETFKVLGETCTPNIDIVEYGLYNIDTQAGTAQYALRSQIVLVPTDPSTTYCVTCTLMGIMDLVIPCNPAPGDKAAGLTAIFGGT